MSACGACLQTPSERCVNAFARIGVVKVHWECWSACNLSCQFCYRTLDEPVEGRLALRLVDILATAGVSALAFVGGDPSLRRDLPTLTDRARSHMMRVEIQTNCHHVTSTFADDLRRSDLVGISLDGGESQTHDEFRGKPGNFKRVVSVLELLAEANVPVLVRSVVGRSNAHDLHKLGTLLNRYGNVARWSLLQFSPVGLGQATSQRYEITMREYDCVVRQCSAAYRGRIDAYKAPQKVGTYALMTASGRLYTTKGDLTSDGWYPTIGNILHDDLGDLADRLPFSSQHHSDRYGWEKRIDGHGP